MRLEYLLFRATPVAVVFCPNFSRYFYSPKSLVESRKLLRNALSTLYFLLSTVSKSSLYNALIAEGRNEAEIIASEVRRGGLGILSLLAQLVRALH